MTPKEELEELRARARMEDLERRSAPPSHDAQHAAAIAPHIDPSLPVTPQVLATQPATTHPGGDEAAKSDWLVRGADSAKGTTVVYEPPLAVARDELLSKPELVNALFPDGGITPEYIQMMDDSSDIYKTYADHKWDEARWAAADSGQTLYRQSKMPWLGGEGSGLSPLSGLVTKMRATVDPAVEGTLAFVLGYDDSATLGAGRRAGEALDRAIRPDKQKSISDLITGGEGKVPERPPSDGSALGGIGETFASAFDDQKGSPLADAVRGASASGGVSEQAISGADPEAVNEMLIEEHGGLHTAGQLAGMFSSSGVLGQLGKSAAGITRAAGALAARGGGKAVAQGAAKLAGAGVAAAAAGGAIQAGREGVEAAANLGKTGETGTTLGEAAGRSVEAGLNPVNLGLGVGGEALGMAAGRVARGIAQSPRYGGNVERVEQLGGKIKFGKGPVGTPRAEAAIVAGKARDTTGQDVMAAELAPKIAAAEKAVAAGESAVAKGQIEQAKLAKEHGNRAHNEFKEKFYPTREGQQVFPPTETIGTNLRKLRKNMQAQPDGGLRPVGDAKGLKFAKAQLNADVAEVSLKPTPGAIELTPDEAEAFLAPTFQSKLVPRTPKGPPGGGAPPPAGKPPAPPGPNAQGVTVLKPQASVPVGEAPTVPPKGQAAKPAGKVEAEPVRTADTMPVESPNDVATREYRGAMRPYRGAQKADNARAAELAKEFPLEPVPDDVKALLAKGALGAAVGAGAAAAGDDENGALAAAAGGLALYGGRRLKPRAIQKAVSELSRRTADAVKRLTPEEKQAISGWSSSSYHTKRAFEAVGRTAEENAVKMRELGYSEEQIAKQNIRRGEKFGSERDEEIVKTMNGAMDKLAIDNPTDRAPLFRAFNAGDTAYDMPDLESLLTKDTFVNKTPISTSINPHAVKDFYSNSFMHQSQSPVILEFDRVHRAVPRVHPDIQTLSESARRREAEVLIPPGSTFRVVERKRQMVRRQGATPNETGAEAEREALIIRLEQIEDAPREAWKDAAMIAGVLGIGAASEDDTGASAAMAGGLALALKKRGVGKVYVTARRYNAQHHEERIGQLKTLSENPQMPVAREARELYAAALKDRQQRSLGGKPGGWASVQKGFSDRLTGLDAGIQGAEQAATRKEAAVLKKTPEAAHKKLVRYSQQRKGEGPLKESVEAAGARAGVLPQLRDLRLIDPLEQLRNAMVTRPGVSRTPTSPRGFLGGTVDNIALRGLYPGLKSASGEMSPLRGGMLGQRIQALGDNTPEEEER